MLRCVLLATGAREWVAVDVATGAIVRSHASGHAAFLGAGRRPGGPTTGVLATDLLATDVEPEQTEPWSPSELGAQNGPGGIEADGGTAEGDGTAAVAATVPLRPLDVVDLELADDDEPPDPARPEAVALAGPPWRVGTARHRALRRILQGLLPVDSKRPLLGSLGPSIAYEDLDGTRPSVAVITADRPPAFATDERGTWCQFTLGGRKHRLAVLDERVIAATTGRRGELHGSDAVAAAIGGAPRYLVVGLGPPFRGQSPKLVLGVLPRP